jgi:hypothetical protein
VQKLYRQKQRIDQVYFGCRDDNLVLVNMGYGHRDLAELLLSKFW